MTDSDLLHAYAREASQAAFTELVRRHVDLVYSSARRQLRSPDLTQEVVQSVFLDLARNPDRVDRNTPLVAWLHLVTRRTAIDVIRRESRRHTRERTAAALAQAEVTENAMTPPSSDWPPIEPLLDEAVESLPAKDRTAILLRYFENKSLREVGAALGLNDDAAQKRVSRALDQLRIFFAHRGVTVSAAGLATGLSSQAVQLAPVSLAPAISVSALYIVPAVIPLSPIAHVLTMTTMQKIILTSVLAIAVGTVAVETWIIARQNERLGAVEKQLALRERALRALRDDRDELARKLAAQSAQLAAAEARQSSTSNAADPAIEEALDSWLQRVVQLRRELERMPVLQIPELQLLEPKDWLDATKEPKLETEMDVRSALNTLRRSAKTRFFERLAPAVRRYCEANKNQRPTDVAQLLPYFEQPVDPNMLQRYGVYSAAELASEMPTLIGSNGKPPEWLIREKQPVDDYFDSTFSTYEGGTIITPQMSKFDREVAAAVKSFRAANNGAKPRVPEQLTPYLKSTIDRAFIQRQLTHLR